MTMSQTQPSLDIGLIGNNRIAALVDRQARICFACFPALYGDPVFSSLINGNDPKAGYWDIAVKDQIRCESAYLGETAILRHVLTDRHGSVAEVLDFCPRSDADYPMLLMRLVRPLSGAPELVTSLKPLGDYGAVELQAEDQHGQITWDAPYGPLHLNSNAPVQPLMTGKAIPLDRPVALCFGESVNPAQADDLLEATSDWWRNFVEELIHAPKGDRREAVIRAAITLQLTSYAPSGGMVAAFTTSVPEHHGSERNWDYRFVWLRDSFYTLDALTRLGSSRALKDYKQFCDKIIAEAHSPALQPLYGLNGEQKLSERVVEYLQGYRGMGPVRSGNLAYIQQQNDNMGSVILALEHLFHHDVLADAELHDMFTRLEPLGDEAARLFDQPDAGIWEYRTIQRVQTYSALMCWASCAALSRMADQLGLDDRCRHWADEAHRLREVIAERSYNADMNSFVDCFDGRDMDASILMLARFGLVPATDPRFLGTLDCIGEHLLHGQHLYRYVFPDDFGEPETAFTICTFWFADALARAGRLDQAKGLYDNLIASRNSFGLLSEDIDTRTGELWGNFPQAYSMAGLIMTALTLEAVDN
ncbi:MAG: glycoside hydrolase family 15 protein [Alphaproteobacteria bacterium]